MLFFNIKIFVNYVQLLYYTHELYMYVFTPENYNSEIINITIQSEERFVGIFRVIIC